MFHRSLSSPYFALVTLGVLTLINASCGRTDTDTGFTPENAAELSAATALSTQNQSDIATLSTRQAEIADESDAQSITLADHAARIVDLEAGGAAGGPFNDEVIRIDDQEAAGFVGQGDINNVELAFANTNQRLNAQSNTIGLLDASITQVQNGQPGALSDAIEEVASDAVTAAIPLEIQPAIQPAIDASIQAAITTLIDERIAPLEAALVNMSKGLVLGVSAATSGDAGGLSGATALCAVAFPDDAGAHMCSMAEVHHAVSRGNGVDVAQAWIMPSMSAAFAAGAYFGAHYDAAANTNQMSCNSMTHAEPAATATALGSTLAVAGGTINLTPSVDCSTSLPVLCCL